MKASSERTSEGPKQFFPLFALPSLSPSSGRGSNSERVGSPNEWAPLLWQIIKGFRPIQYFRLDSFLWKFVNTESRLAVQGDTSGCGEPPVDIKTTDVLA